MLKPRSLLSQNIHFQSPPDRKYHTPALRVTRIRLLVAALLFAVGWGLILKALKRRGLNKVRAFDADENASFFRGNRYLPLNYNVEGPPAGWGIPFGSGTHYQKIEKLGKGNYATVWLGIDHRTSQRVVIKYLKDIEPRRIIREMDAMLALKHPNVLNLIDAFIGINDQVCLVFEAFEGAMEPSGNRISWFSEDDVRFYTRQLLEVISFTHSRDWMHRDLKPENLLLSREKRKLLVIDWGLATIHRNNSHSSDVASLHYRAPELLLDDSHYGHPIDVWSVGVIFGEWLFGVEMLFKDSKDERGDRNQGQILEIARALGGSGMHRLIDSAEIYCPTRTVRKLADEPGMPWADFVGVKRARQHSPSPEALQLLSQFLRWDPNDRISASEALRHPFFGKL